MTPTGGAAAAATPAEIITSSHHHHHLAAESAPFVLSVRCKSSDAIHKPPSSPSSQKKIIKCVLEEMREIALICAGEFVFFFHSRGCEFNFSPKNVFFPASGKMQQAICQCKQISSFLLPVRGNIEKGVTQFVCVFK